MTYEAMVDLTRAIKEVSGLTEQSNVSFSTLEEGSVIEATEGWSAMLL